MRTSKNLLTGRSSLGNKCKDQVPIPRQCSLGRGIRNMPRLSTNQICLLEPHGCLGMLQDFRAGEYL